MFGPGMLQFPGVYGRYDPVSIFNRIDLSVLYPPFVAKLQLLAAALEARGVVYFATCGERSWEEQAKLYQVGRGTGTPGHFVTKARPGYSMHNHACACDFAADEDDDEANGLQPNWTSEAYDVLAEEATKLGLEAGHYWKFKDSPHIQLPLSKHGLSINDLIHAHEQGGKEAVFALLDQVEW